MNRGAQKARIHTSNYIYYLIHDIISNKANYQ